MRLVIISLFMASLCSLAALYTSRGESGPPPQVIDQYDKAWKLTVDNKMSAGFCADTNAAAREITFRTNETAKNRCGDPRESVEHELMHVCLGVETGAIRLDHTLYDGLSVHGVIYLMSPCMYRIMRANPDLERWMYR